MSIIEKAKDFAHAAHDSIGQRRKYTGEPYWVHTDEVATIVATATKDSNVIAAAHLHDVLEDVFPKNPTFGPAAILAYFGPQVLRHVIDLTDVFTKESYPALNRAKRKEAERLRVSVIETATKSIKLADLISNSRSILAYDKDFARVYLQEKLALLGCLSDGNPTLLNEATQITITGLSELGINLPRVVANP